MAALALPVQGTKISVDAGFTCPNRDGRISRGGCTFCNNDTFNPSYCNKDASVSEQLETGKRFFAHKYPDMRYLAYFQAFTNTYAPLDTLKRLYEEALSTDGVVGIVIGTRPDCVSPTLLDYLATLARQTFVSVEYGIESTNDATLKRINRGHTFDCARRAIADTAARGIVTGGHVILGLPGEDREESLRQANTISATALHTLKIHQLQIIRGTRLAREYAEQPFHLYSPDEYIGLLTEYIRRLRPDIVLDRFTSQSPSDMLVAPRWGLKTMSSPTCSPTTCAAQGRAKASCTQAAAKADRRTPASSRNLKIIFQSFIISGNTLVFSTFYGER